MSAASSSLSGSLSGNLRTLLGSYSRSSSWPSRISSLASRKESTAALRAPYAENPSRAPRACSANFPMHPIGERSMEPPS